MPVMKVRQSCDYCGGWDEEVEVEAEACGPYHSTGVAENSAFDVQTAARGRRRMCARCLIDWMDSGMKSLQKKRQQDRAYR